MAQTPVDLQGTFEQFPSFGGKCIIKVFSTVTNGRTLDVTGFTPTIIKEGHPIIKDANGLYKPLPVDATGKKFETAPEGSTYVGLLISNIETTKPFAGIMNAGLANFQAMPYSPEDILTELKTNLTAIVNNK